MLYSLFEQHGVSGFYPVPVSTVKDIIYYPHLRGFDPLQWFKQIDTDTIDFYSCVAGHYDWDMANKLQDWQVITLLRHPVDQLRSLYQYMAREEKEDYNKAKYLQHIGFDGWLISDDIKQYLNGQTRYLSGHDIWHVRYAMQNLQSERVTFGLVERYADSLNLFNKKFGWELKEQKRNVSPNVVVLEPDVYQECVKLQSADMQLYEYALDNFDKQFEGIEHGDYITTN